MALTIKVVGQASKRGIIPRLPAPERLLADVRDWVSTEYPAFVRSAHLTTEAAPADAADEEAPAPPPEDVKETKGGKREKPAKASAKVSPKAPARPAVASHAELVLSLYPGAEPITVTADLEGRVTAAAETSAIGPGYHTFVARILERIEEELGIAWDRPEAPRPVGAPRGWIGARTPLAERGAVEQEHLVRLGRVLASARELRRRGAGGIQVGTLPGTQFTFDGAIATPLGPRDDAWLDLAVRDPRIAIDVRPWWTDSTDAHHLLQRALVILWTEIRWRLPGDDVERACMDEALGLLRKALPSDATLPYPWLEWAELLTLRGIPDPVSDRVMERARRAARDEPPRELIGYRRRPVTIIHEGWALGVPGSFGEQRTPEEWQGGERGRRVTLAATTVTTATGMPMSADWFLARVAGDLGDGVLHHQDGELRGRAKVGTEAGTGVEVAMLEGFSAVTGRGAAIRVEFEDPDDWRWAVELWRSLRPA